MAEDHPTDEERRLQEKRAIAAAAKRRYRQKYPEKAKEANRKAKGTESYKASQKKWVEKNKGYFSAWWRDFRIKNPERMAQLDREAYLRKRTGEARLERERENGKAKIRKFREKLKSDPERLAKARKAANKFSKLWREENKEKSRENNRKYLKTEHGRQVRRVCEARRQARKAKAENTLTTAEWKGIVEAHGNACCYCKRPFTRELLETIDHCTPYSRGGGNTAANVVPACASCNSAKGVKTFAEFLAWKEE